MKFSLQVFSIIKIKCHRFWVVKYFTSYLSHIICNTEWTKSFQVSLVYIFFPCYYASAKGKFFCVDHNKQKFLYFIFKFEINCFKIW